MTATLMREPWDRQAAAGWRLGLYLGKAPGNATASSLGWAAVSLGKHRKLASGRIPSTPEDMVDRILTQLEIQTKLLGHAPDGIDLYRYGNEQAFLQSAACAEGMALVDHTLLISRTARTLRQMGHTVTMRTVK